mmetsp:Transcript_34962/g.62990  ORF Transcript_34962/g.62990 Transcript_34962/m.62990 type:complete len:662 (+) Transcript_34962:86-2071(+)
MLPTLKEITSSLQDNANLQKLKENLQELPKRWLTRLDQNASQDYLLGSVSGECNYHFTFKLEGGGLLQTGVLVASAESTPSGGLPVPLKCRWKRRVGDLPMEIPGVTSNMYQISADDVGTDICVEAQPADMDDGHHGVVVGEIGPFELDPATRRSLDNALGLGGSRFTVMQSRLPGEPAAPNSRQDLVIQVSTEGVRVSPVQGKEGREVYAEYSGDYPRVIIHPLDTSKFQLVLSGSKTFHLIALSRTSRDLIALTIRCFHAKKYLSTATILQELLPVQQPLAAGSPLPAANGRLDSCIVLERLSKELNRSMQQKEISEKVLRNTNHEKKQLQAQLMETISGFTEVIEGLNDQCPEGLTTTGGPPASVDRLQDQLREVSYQNQALQAELHNMRCHLEKLQDSRQAMEAKSRSAKNAGAGPEAQVHQLKDERDMLKVRLEELSSSSATLQQQDTQDQVHTQELKRHRQDVESLHNQKEELRRQLQDQDKERQELQDNFLYVKSQLDKVQMKQAQGDGSADGERELQRHRQTLDSVLEERSRLAHRLESVLRDAEKEKAYHEQSVERVMTANGRLMEERDRTAKEVERLSRLYAESVNQLQGDLNQTNMTSGIFRTDSGSSPLADPAVVAKVQGQLAEVEEAIRSKEQENESLKNRIRKLAVA